MAVIDASVLIPVARTGKLFLLKKYFKAVHTTALVEQEILAKELGLTELRKALRAWIYVKETGELKEISMLAHAENLSEADASLLWLAEKNKETLMTSDYRLTRVAKARNVEALWLTAWVLVLAKEGMLSKKEAKDFLLELVKSGVWLKATVFADIEKRIDEL